MMKIKKPLITRIVGNRHACSLLIAIIFLFTETGYSADRPCLRVPIGVVDRERVDEAARGINSNFTLNMEGNPDRLSLNLKERIATNLADLGVRKQDIQVIDDGSILSLIVQSDIISWVGFHLYRDNTLPERIWFLKGDYGKTLAVILMQTIYEEYQKHGLMTLLFTYLIAQYDVDTVILELTGSDGKALFKKLQSVGLIGEIQEKDFGTTRWAKTNKENALRFLGIELLPARRLQDVYRYKMEPASDL